MPEHTDKPERDTSPSGEISARQNEDGTYEIVAGESSSANAVPDPERPKKASSPGSKDSEDATIRSPLTVGLLVLTLLAAGGTVAYFAMGSSSDGAEQAAGEDDPSFRPYAGDDEAAQEAAKAAAAMEQDPAEPDASSLENDAGPKERKTEIIVLEEGVDETDPDESQGQDDNSARVDPSNFQRIEVGPGAAARIKDSVRLKVDPAELRGIKFTNGNIPEAKGQEVRDRDKDGVESEADPEEQPTEELDDQVENPVIE